MYNNPRDQKVFVSVQNRFAWLSHVDFWVVRYTQHVCENGTIHLNQHHTIQISHSVYRKAFNVIFLHTSNAFDLLKNYFLKETISRLKQ